MDITRTSGKRVSDGQRDLVAAGSKKAAFHKLWTTLAGVVFGMLLIVPGLARAQYRFTTIEQPPGAINSAANGNSLFEIVGEFADKDGNLHGFVLTKGVFKKDVFTTIDVPGAAGTSLNGINVFGRLVGTYFDPPGPFAVPPGTAHCFVADKVALAKKSAFTTLDPPGAIRSQGGFLNAQGEVVGTYRDVDQKRHGFIWRKGNFTPFSVPNDHPVFGTVAMGINDIGQIVGNYVDVSGNNVLRHGFLRSSKGVYKPFDVPGRTFTSASGINNAGQIVGFYADDDFNFHGFVLSSALAILKGKEGDYKYVDVPDAVETQINSINSKGEIVGFYVDADGKQHAFLGTPIHGGHAH